MKRILYIRKSPVGGTDGTVNYCEALSELFRDNNGVCQALRIPEIPEHSVPFLKYRYSSADLKKYITEADIIHINGYTALGTIQALRMAHRLGKRVVFTAHFHPFSHLRHPLLGKVFFHCLMRPAIKRWADIAVTINGEDTRFFRTFFKNTKRIPHWLAETPEPTLLGRKSNMILFVGRFNDPVKGLDSLLSLPQGRYDIHCVGRGSTDISRSDITFHSNIPTEELDSLYRQASAVIIPSRYEAFSYVALEALLRGCPVAMSDRVRIGDYLDSVEGCTVFPYGDHDAMNNALKKAISMKVDTDRVRAIFSREQAYRDYLEVYCPEC